MIKRCRLHTALFTVVLGVVPGIAAAQTAQGTDGPSEDVGKLLDDAQAADKKPAPPPEPPPTQPATSGELRLSPEAEAAAAAPPPASSTPSAPSSTTTTPSSPSRSEPSASSASDPLWTGTARFADRYYEAGIIAGSGGGLLFAEGAESVGLTGIRVLEHHGYIAKFVTMLLVAMGQSDKHYEGSTYSRSGDYVVRTDYYRELTPSEREAQQRQLSAAADGQYTTEVTVFTPRLFGLDPGKTQGGGFEASMGADFVLGFSGPLPTILTVGAYGSYISSPVQWKVPAQGRPNDLAYTGFGGLLRLHIPVTRFADLSAEWDLNLLSLWHLDADEREKEGMLYQSPLKLGGYVHLTDRAYVLGRAVVGGFGISDGKLGAQAELGIRF